MAKGHDSVAARFTSVGADGTRAAVDRSLAVECPIAIEIDGIGYAVMMATPDALEEFATGFLLSERLITAADAIVDVAAHRADAGIVLRVALRPGHGARLLERVRHRTTDSSCGLCGIENIEAALRPLPRVAARSTATPAAIFGAQAALRAHQPLNRETGSVHAAALCAPDGAIRCVREDVGRHNAFDKLIGAMARDGIGWDGGFALLSSRCSCELVEKAVLAGCPLLAAISAPTALAVDRARAAGLGLAVLARGDSLLWLEGGAP